MGIIKQDQLNNWNPKEHNLDENGDYIECRECQSKLNQFEKIDDTCFLCKVEKD